MPDTYREATFTGSQGNKYPMFEVYVGENTYNKSEIWFGFGLKKAQAILENIDALRRWVDKQDR